MKQYNIRQPPNISLTGIIANVRQVKKSVTFDALVFVDSLEV